MRLNATIQLARAAALEPLHDVGDAELLRRFCRDRDEAAFREIVRRYEGLVRGASRRLTRDRHATDNAVQATFLALARKAHTLRHPAALPSWLYRVARSVAAREAATAPLAADPIDPAPSPLDQLSAREVMALFDEELARLPADHRSAVLLCCMEGHTVGDAAHRLGTTPGAVRGWLQRGRDRLRRRLAWRGVELAVAMPLLFVSSAPAAARVGDTVAREVLQAFRPVSAARLGVGGPAAAVTLVGLVAAGIISSVLLMALGSSDPKPVPPPKAEMTDGPKVEVQITRDNLPDGAVARIGSPRLRHAGDVVAMAFSHDGRRLATASPASRDKSVRVWDLAHGTERLRLPIRVNPHESSVRHRTAAVAFTKDDKRLLVLDEREFRAFDVATGRQELVKVLSKETDGNLFFTPEGIIGTGFSPDQKTFAVVRRNGEMLLGDTASGEVKTTIARSMDLPANTAYSFVNILFTPDGSEVCVPVPADSVPIFDTATGTSRRSLAKALVPQYGAINNAAFTADGRRFVSVVTTSPAGKAPAYAVSVGDVATGKAVRTIPTPTLPRVLSVSPNGKLLAVSTDSVRSSEVRVFDLESGKEVQSMPLDLTPALVAFSPDSRLLAGTCHYEGRVTVWDVEKNALHPHSSDETGFPARFDRLGHVELGRSGRTLTVDWRAGKVVKDGPPHRNRSMREFWSRDGNMRAEVDVPKDKPGKPYLLLAKDGTTGRTVARLEGLSDYPRVMAFADQNRLLATVTQDDVLTVWDLAEQKLHWSEAYPVGAFGYAGMGHPQFDAVSRRMTICSMSQNGTLIDVWDVRRHARLARVEVPRVLLTGDVAFSPDGEFIAGGSEAVTCWRVADGRAVHTLRGHAASESPNERPAIRCEFSADGRKLLTVDGTGTIRVWEAATGQVIRTFTGHNGQTTASFSPDARTIVGASSDAPILLWDVYGLKAAPPFDAERVWTDLANASPETAFRAVRELCASPRQAIALLKVHVKPEVIDRKATDGWIRDLSALRFAVRERATAELEKLGEAIAPRLREALASATDEEARRRLAGILERTTALPPARLRLDRALDALEHLGTPEAREHLETLSRGSPGCLRTVQATEALARLLAR